MLDLAVREVSVLLFVKALVVLLCVCGVFLSFMSIGGTFLIAFGYLIYGIADWQNFSGWFFALLLALSVLGEVVEFFAASLGTKKFGASNLTFFTTLVFGIAGSVWGTFAFPVVGTLIGAVLGAVAAAFATEYFLKGRTGPALKASAGAVAGKTGSILVKTILSIIMSIYVFFKLF